MTPFIDYSRIDSPHIRQKIQQTRFEERERINHLLLLQASIRGQRIGIWQGLGLPYLRKWYAEDYEALKQEDEERIRKSVLLRTMRAAENFRQRLSQRLTSLSLRPTKPAPSAEELEKKERDGWFKAGGK